MFGKTLDHCLKLLVYPVNTTSVVYGGSTPLLDSINSETVLYRHRGYGTSGKFYLKECTLGPIHSSSV